MTVQPADVFEALKQIRVDASSIQVRVNDALKMLAELNLKSEPAARCAVCGLETRGPNTLAEHMHVSHGGPLPEAWVKADELAAAGEAQ